MPIYEYSCRVCSSSFEKLIKSGSKINPACPSCGSLDTVKELSTFSSVGASVSGAECYSGG